MSDTLAPGLATEGDHNGAAAVPATTDALVVDIPTAGAMAGLGRNASYLAAQRGEIPTISLGRRRRVPLKRWRQILNGEDR
jgi:hypothetical protein